MDLSKIDNDFSDEEVEKINTFVKNGCQGLDVLAAEESRINSMFGLYMAGKNYVEISKITKVKKNLVLYMSAKMRWYEKRMEHLNEIQKAMGKRISTTKIESMNFIADLISMHHKYYGDEIDLYLSTGDKTIVENMDLKSLTQYFKSIEILEKIMNPSNVTRGGGSGNTVNVNAPDGATVTQLDENTLEITPGNQGDILKKLAELKDAQNKEEL